MNDKVRTKTTTLSITESVDDMIKYLSDTIGVTGRSAIVSVAVREMYDRYRLINEEHNQKEHANKTSGAGITQDS